MEVLNVLDVNGILRRKTEWENELEKGKASLAHLQNQITQITNTMQALHGAIQACDQFLKDMETSEVQMPALAEISD